MTLSLLLSACGCGKAVASTMYRMKTEGTMHASSWRDRVFLTGRI